MNFFSVQRLTLLLLLFSVLPLSLFARPYVLILSQDDLKDIATTDSDPSGDPSSSLTPPEWDEFGDSDVKPDFELDPGSWRPIFEPDLGPPGAEEADAETAEYYATVRKMLAAATGGEVRMMEEAAAEIEAAAEAGNAHAESVLGFLYGQGQARERNKAKALLYHFFASEGGNMQSKMDVAYTYLRQDVSSLCFLFVILCLNSVSYLLEFR